MREKEKGKKEKFLKNPKVPPPPTQLDVGLNFSYTDNGKDWLCIVILITGVNFSDRNNARWRTKVG